MATDPITGDEVTGDETAGLLPPDAWSAVKQLFDRLMELPAEARDAALRDAEVDEQVREEVRALIEAAGEVDGFLDLPDDERLPAGHRLGRYRLEAHLGCGGMGDVYRAFDEHLKREVAVKVLRAPVIDRTSRARFAREARSIAALSHPHIVAIYDVAIDCPRPYLVTELLRGTTLRTELQRGPIALATVLRWGCEIAEGLAAAHDAGLVHRDIKPANIFIVDGATKILDFGLARPKADAPFGDTQVSASGMVFGTVGYLSPEQARGEAATAASDLFSLGAVLFEMLTGQRAFRGDSAIDTLRSVIEDTPPLPSSLRPEVPAWLDRVVARCLAKERKQRFESARDLGFALQHGLPAAAQSSGRQAGRLPWLLAATSTAIAAALGWQLVRGASGEPSAAPAAIASTGSARPSPLSPLPLQTLTLTHSGLDSAPSVSPDGRFVAFVSTRDDTPRIWLLQRDTGREVPLTSGSDGWPRFSRDGAQLLFVRVADGDSALYRVPLLGGTARRVVDGASSGDWSPDGDRVFFIRTPDNADRTRAQLATVPLAGGPVRVLIELRSRTPLHPRVSPDGRLIAVTGLAQQPGAPQKIALISADGASVRTLDTAHTTGFVSALAWCDADTVVYSQALSVTGNSAGSHAQIVRQRIDGTPPESLLYTPESSIVLDAWGCHQLVFDARSPRQTLVAYDATPGDEPARPLTRGLVADRQPALSPNEDELLFSSNRGANLDIWALSLASGAAVKRTDHPADDWDPAYTPDGRQLLWSSNRSGSFEIWMADRDGSHPRQITDDGDAENPSATSDGRWIIYSSGVPARRGIWRIHRDGGSVDRIVPNAILPEVSPDGRYVLFQRNKPPNGVVIGVAEIDSRRLLPFSIDISTVRRTIAALGRARWLPDGRAIAYTGQQPSGHSAIFIQTFNPEGSAAAARVWLQPPPHTLLESFDMGRRISVVAEWEQRSTIVAAAPPPAGK